MGAWTHTVLLDAGDITSETTLDSVRIEEAENESAICDIRWRPPSGGQQPGLLFQTLELRVDLGSGDQVLFSGKVIRVDWDERERTYQLRASNRLQDYFRELGSDVAVETALAPAGVSVSADFFRDPPEDLWQYAEQLLETSPYEAHLDRAGVLQLVPWAAKGTADISLTASDIDGTQGPDWIEADASSKTNRVDLELDMEIERWKVRSHDIGWSFSLEPQTATFCDWIQGIDGAYWPPPVLSEVQSVAEGGSWNVPAGVAADQIPLDETDLCFPGMGALGWQFERDSNPLRGFSVVGYAAFACRVQEHYRIVVEALGAQTHYGDVVAVRRQAAFNYEDAGDWPPSAASIGSLPETPLTDAIGDYYNDRLDETRRAAFLDTGFAWARTAILQGNRSDSRRFRTVLRPDILLEHTVLADVYGTSSKAKVRRLVHTLSPFRTEITLALSIGGGTDSGYTTPARPPSDDPVTYWEGINGPGTYLIPSAGHSIPTYVGSRTTSPDKNTFDPDEEGFFTNAVNFPGFSGNPDQIYDRELVLIWPEREEEATGDLVAVRNDSFTIAVPEDLI